MPRGDLRDSQVKAAKRSLFVQLHRGQRDGMKVLYALGAIVAEVVLGLGGRQCWRLTHLAGCRRALRGSGFVSGRCGIPGPTMGANSVSASRQPVESSDRLPGSSRHGLRIPPRRSASSGAWRSRSSFFGRFSATPRRSRTAEAGSMASRSGMGLAAWRSTRPPDHSASAPAFLHGAGSKLGAEASGSGQLSSRLAPRSSI